MRTETASQLVDVISHSQAHRGPDETVMLADAWFSLGHTRLAINALGSSGAQPLASEDGRWLAVYNGEIYNHRHLRASLELNGIGDSDGAVIPEVLARKGPDGLQLLRGMYAIVAVDTLTRQVLLAVDPFGIKPLHWAYDHDGLVVASEPKALLPVVGRKDLAVADVANFLHRGSFDNAASGLVGVHRVAPGRWIAFNESGTPMGGDTWKSETPSLATTWPHVSEVFQESVRAHLLSDVPVAVLLSDGVDSSAIASIVAHERNDVTAITVDLGGQGRGESTGATEMARHLGIRHEVVTSSPTQEAIDDFFRNMQRPTIDGLNTYLVSGAVASHGIRVALSGIGADEFLTGYASVRQFALARTLRRIPAPLAPRVLAAASRHSVGESASRLESVRNMHADSLGDWIVALSRQVWTTDWVVAATGRFPTPWPKTGVMASMPGAEPLGSMSAAQVDLYLTGQLLPDADAFSMAHSLELRVPFVDVSLARAIMCVPGRRASKHEFVTALGVSRIAEVHARPKQGFSLPMAALMDSGALRPAVLDLESSTAPIRQLLAPAVVDSAVVAWGADKRHWYRLWSLAVLNSWLTSLGI